MPLSQSRRESQPSLVTSSLLYFCTPALLRPACFTHLSLPGAVQCIVLNEPKTGSRKVAGTHWDFNSYGGELKKAMGIAPQARVFPYPSLSGSSLVKNSTGHAALPDSNGLSVPAAVLRVAIKRHMVLQS